MTVSRPEGHPTDDQLREWREWAVTQNIYKGTKEPWSPLVIAIDALVGERAAHTIDEKALRLAARACDGFIVQVRQLEAELAAERAAHTATKAENESFYAIRRTDGEEIGDFAWMGCDGPGDWTVADDAADWDDGPVEYEIVRMTVEPVAKRTFGDPAELHIHEGDECAYCGEKWPCDYRAVLSESPVPNEGTPRG